MPVSSEPFRPLVVFFSARDACYASQLGRFSSVRAFFVLKLFGRKIGFLFEIQLRLALNLTSNVSELCNCKPNYE